MEPEEGSRKLIFTFSLVVLEGDRKVKPTPPFCAILNDHNSNCKISSSTKTLVAIRNSMLGVVIELYCGCVVRARLWWA